MRPSSLGGGRILRRTLSVRLSVRPVLFYIRTSVTCFRQPCGRAVSFVLFTLHVTAAYSTGSQPHKLVRLCDRDAFERNSISNIDLAMCC